MSALRTATAASAWATWARPISSSIARIVAARQETREYTSQFSDSRLQFYEPDQYFQFRSIRDNILFGQPKAGRGGALERINQNLLQLLLL